MSYGTVRTLPRLLRFNQLKHITRNKELVKCHDINCRRRNRSKPDREKARLALGEVLQSIQKIANASYEEMPVLFISLLAGVQFLNDLKGKKESGLKSIR